MKELGTICRAKAQEIHYLDSLLYEHTVQAQKIQNVISVLHWHTVQVKVDIAKKQAEAVYKILNTTTPLRKVSHRTQRRMSSGGCPAWNYL